VSVSTEPAPAWPARLALPAWAPAAGAIALLALLLRLVCGVGFVNYDTLYALAWGGQLARGETPAYGTPIAPTPHPLLELLGLVLTPLGASATSAITVALGFLALAACGWAVYRLAREAFGPLAGVLAGAILLTRVPVLSYGVRAYVDVPYMLLILCALLVELRRRRAGTPVLLLLALAGLLRPEAWAFSGLYWLYLLPERHRLPFARLTLLAISAPLLWLASDLLVTGDPLWSLTNTRHTAHTLGRVRGIGNVPEYVPRRIGEILHVPALAAAALGGVLSLWLARERSLQLALAGVAAVVVLAAFAALGLPIDTRYAFLAAAILCVFAAAGLAGWTVLPRTDRRRRWWMAASALLAVALLAYAPSQYRLAHREMGKLARQQGIEKDLLALVRSHAIALRCGPVGVPNHAPVPLLALYLRTSPRNVIGAESGHIARGVYVDPASAEVEEGYVLDPRDPHEAVSVPPGFRESAANRSWLIFQGCG
jgi:hypothetical protein